MLTFLDCPGVRIFDPHNSKFQQFYHPIPCSSNCTSPYSTDQNTKTELSNAHHLHKYQSNLFLGSGILGKKHSTQPDRKAHHDHGPRSTNVNGTGSIVNSPSLMRNCAKHSENGETEGSDEKHSTKDHSRGSDMNNPHHLLSSDNFPYKRYYTWSARQGQGYGLGQVQMPLWFDLHDINVHASHNNNNNASGNSAEGKESQSKRGPKNKSPQRHGRTAIDFLGDVKPRYYGSGNLWSQSFWESEEKERSNGRKPETWRGSVFEWTSWNDGRGVANGASPGTGSRSRNESNGTGVSMATLMRCFTILKVPKSSSFEIIRQAYRQLARQHHPDINDHPQAKERFQEIRQAFEILSAYHEKSSTDTSYNSASATTNVKSRATQQDSERNTSKDGRQESKMLDDKSSTEKFEL